MSTYYEWPEDSEEYQSKLSALKALRVATDTPAPLPAKTVQPGKVNDAKKPAALPSALKPINVEWDEPEEKTTSYLPRQFGGSTKEYLRRQFAEQPEATLETSKDLPLDLGNVSEKNIVWDKDEEEETAKQKPSSWKDNLALGIAESLASTLVLSPVSSVASGLVGIPALLQGDAEKSANIIGRTQEDITYRPRTTAGKKVEEKLSGVFQWWHDLLDKSNEQRRGMINRIIESDYPDATPEQKKEVSNLVFGNVQSAIAQGVHDLIPGLLAKRVRGEPNTQMRSKEYAGDYIPGDRTEFSASPKEAQPSVYDHTPRPSEKLPQQGSILWDESPKSLPAAKTGKTEFTLGDYTPPSTPVKEQPFIPTKALPFLEERSLVVEKTTENTTPVTQLKLDVAVSAMKVAKPSMVNAKNTFLTELDNLIKAAPKENKIIKEMHDGKFIPVKEKIKISIPGDGEFVVLNNKQRLLDLRSQVAKEWSTKSTTELSDRRARPKKLLADSFLKDGELDNFYNAAMNANIPIKFGLVRERGEERVSSPFIEIDSFLPNTIPGFFSGKRYIDTNKGTKAYWSVINEDTGLSIGGGDTKKLAIEDANRTIERMGIDKIESAVANHKKIGQTGLKNLFLKRIGIDSVPEIKASDNKPQKTRPSKPKGLGKKQGGAVSLEPLHDLVEKLKYVGKQTGNALDAVARTTFYSSAQRVRDIGTPTAHKIADMFRAPLINQSGKPVAPTYFERRDIVVGRNMKRLDALLEPLYNRLGKLPKSKADDLVANLRGEKQVSQELLPVAQDLRKFIDSVREYAIKAGLDVGKLENYFPRIYDVDIVARKQDALKTVLKKYGIPEDAADSIIYTIIQNDGFGDFLNTPNRQQGKGGYPNEGRAFGVEGFASKSPNLEHSRKLTFIPDKELAPFLENDLIKALSRYVYGSAKRVEYARSFGPKEEILNALVNDMVVEARQAHVPMSPQDMAGLVYDLADAAMNKYNPIVNRSMEKLNRATIAFEIMSKLGLVAVTSLVENVATLSTTSPKVTIPAVAKALTHSVIEASAMADRFITGSRHIPKLEMTKVAEEMGLIVQDALESASANIFSMGSGKMTKSFMRLVLHEQVTNLNRIFSQQVGLGIIRRNANYLRKKSSGNKAADYKRQLIEMGITPEEAMNLDNPRNANRAKFAATRWSNWVAQNPNAASLPYWMSDPHWAHVALFKKFSASFANTFLKKFALEMKHSKSFSGKSKLIVSSLLMTLAAYYVQYLRDFIGWGTGENPYNKDQTKPERLLAAVDRSGISGHTTYLFALLQPRYGFFDSMEKRILNLAGPGITDAARVSGALVPMDAKNKNTARGRREAKEKRDKAVAKEAARLTPLLNIYRPVRSWLEEAYFDALDGK